MARVSSSATMSVAAEVDRLRRDGVEVFDLGAGEPDFPTPAAVKAAAHAAIDQNFTRYTPSAGMAELKRAIVERYRTDYGVEYVEPEVIVSAGGKQALFNAVLALVGPGDDVITHAPGWSTLVEQIRFAEARPIVVRTHPEDGFALGAAAILDALTPRTRAIVLNSPCNPTGALLAEREFELIAAEAARRGLWVILDLCYEKLIYEAPAPNLPAIAGRTCRDRAVICGSASKTYAMTGWRCGWSLAPSAVVAASNVIQSHSTSNVSSVTQKAVVAALTGSQAPVQAMLAEYRERRDRLHAWLAADPRLRSTRPAGAFYLFIDISDFLAPEGLRTSADFARALLEETRVAVMPGEAFDAPGFIRLSFAAALDRLTEAAGRLLAFTRSREASHAVAAE